MKNLASGLVLATALLLGPAHAQQQAAPPPAVVVEPAEMQVIAQRADFVGRIEAIEKVELRARITGFLKQVTFTEGDRVKEGETLFEIEPEPFQAAIDQREAQLASAKAELQNAEINLKRSLDLVKTNAVAQAQVDQRQADAAKARASVLQMEAALREAEIQFSYTTIEAPISGRIGRTAFTRGNLVDPSSGVLATIVRDDEVRAVFNVTQREILDYRKSGGGALTVRLRLADGSLYDKPGKLDFIDVVSDQKTDSQLVRAVFPNPDHILTDGQTIRVVIERAEDKPSVTVPQAAVAVDQAGSYTFVVDQANKVEQRRIKTGPQREGRIAVTEGLKGGELVIVEGLQRVRAGMEVAPQRAETVN
ncbi:efflux RND transporter periplasmic adaptor subunit [Nordella sp. HKS 07]|uniref:efflux RND transporter periplasmic adaptor subunit n=1 Tax=Nordella sp. HKS 07 TaxID=2712222 RepID=UPI0013E1EC3D|nr:efflux RND transporter periplasmic adaptor subunit [Nordella sp. HKS 07]QIG48794.1 efflux RND transporter periplasmic adaptor subunit [Nordella sp. HKS 07]